MKLKDLLSSYKMSKLADICRTLKISGFSTQKQQGLIELVFQSINNKAYIKELIDSLPESALYLLATIVNLGKKTTANNIRSVFAQHFEHSRFTPNVSRLLSMGLVYLYEGDEDDVICIPDEFYPWFQQNIVDNEITIKEEQAVDPIVEEKVAYKTFDSLLYSSWVSIDMIRLLLAEKGASIEGSKSTLITRLLYEIQLSPGAILDAVFMKDDLRDIVGELGLLKGGNKPDLIVRILETLPLKYSIETYQASGAEEIDESETTEQSIEKPPTLLKFFMSDYVDTNKVRSFLDGIGIDSTGTRREVSKRLLETSQISLPEVFESLFNGDELKDLCTRFGLKKGGKKSDIVQRIIEILPAGNLNVDVQSRLTIEVEGGGSISTDTVVQKIRKPPSTSGRKPKPLEHSVEDQEVTHQILDLANLTLNTLKTIDIDYTGISSDESLGSSVMTFLKTTLKPQKIDVDRGSINTKGNKKAPDIFAIQAEEKIYVETIYVEPSKATTNTLTIAKSQFFDFSSDYGKDKGIFLFYDKDHKIGSTEIKKFKEQLNGFLIYITKDGVVNLDDI